MTATRLLIIEPAAALRDTLRDAFVRSGWTVQVTESATTGLAIASWFRPNAVLVDLHEPAVSPSTFATLLRFGRFERVLIVGTTTAEDTAATPHAAAVDEVMIKPFAPDDVLRVIDRLRADANGS